MTPVEEQVVQFADLESGQQVELRSVSRLSIAALFLALLSLSILASPLFWFLPLASSVAALWSLRNMQRKPGLLGRKTAVIALIISLFLLGFAPARHIARQASLRQHALDFANDWLSRLQRGELKAAHQLTMSYYERAAPAADLEKHYEQRFPTGGDRMRSMMEIQDPHSELVTFLARPPMPDLAEAGDGLQWQIDRCEIINQFSDTTVIHVFCQLTFPGPSGPRKMPLRLEMERKFVRETSISYWRVRDIVDLQAAAS